MHSYYPTAAPTRLNTAETNRGLYPYELILLVRSPFQILITAPSQMSAKLSYPMCGLTQGPIRHGDASPPIQRPTA
jgi:hypothetical protein